MFLTRLLLNKYAAALAVIALVIAGVLWYGNTRYYEGQRALLTTIEQAKAKSVKEKQDIDNAINALSDDDLLARALGFVRTGVSR